MTMSNADNEFCYNNINGSCPKLVRSISTQLILYFFCGVAIVMTVMGNLLVIISVSHFKVLHSPTNFLSLSLALIDCLLGLVVLPFSSVRSVETCWYFGDTFCVLHSGFDTFLCLASVFHLCCISIDRYYAICDPLLYSTKITVFVAFVFITVSWTVAIVYSFAMLYSKQFEKKLEMLLPTASVNCIGSCQLAFMSLWGWINFSIFFIPCFVMLGLYLKIFSVARRQAKIIDGKPDNNQHGHRSHKASKRERRAAKTLGITVGVYLFCWLPFIIQNITDVLFDFITPSVIVEFLFWMNYINSAFNPLIYGFFYPWFRKALKFIVSGKIFHQGSAGVNLFQE
ncbi:trace amine-associated receptor 5-like [Protopterus annectens]|uniref:trace amine-associated receptor 5-like n=1 Tax=Protopterus annectens TaxID=7888 RepID=UPI001CFC0907|nr:trace amine-associated receptor 5-like [Protopterus annectens]